MSSHPNNQKILTNLSDLEKIYLKKDYKINEKQNYDQFDLSVKELSQVSADIISDNIKQMETNNDFLLSAQETHQETENLLECNKILSHNYSQQINKDH